jgi:Fe-S-cluster containining protein
MTNTKTPKPQTPKSECMRCGTCCEKGGPCFHHKDRLLIEKGVIPTKFLYTIRKGELAYDNVKGRLIPVDSDVIKIKGKKGSWICTYYDEEKKACGIYSDRPLECKVLKCWDTRELEQIYAERRLTRRDLISDIEGLWDLISDHQQRCDYDKIKKLIKDVTAGNRDIARKELMEIIHFDKEIRKLVVSKGGLDPEMLDFVFGRPLTKTIENYGLKIRQKGEKIHLDES